MSSSVLHIVGFFPQEWRRNSVEWYKLTEWVADFKNSWNTDKKLRRKLMKLALAHPSWTIELYNNNHPMYIQIRASSQVVEDEAEADRISECHNIMYPRDFCCFAKKGDYVVVAHNPIILPLKVNWEMVEVEKAKLTVIEEDNN
jgi:hypothetical protein